MNGLDAIGAAFAAAHGESRAALMPYFTLGYPDQASCLDIVQAISQAGADLIELGVPFSDPLADGPTIQNSTQIALQQGTTTRRCLEMVAELRSRGVNQPFFLMGYYNPILNFGVSHYLEAARSAGADGLIVPDVPVEEAAELETACGSNRLALVYLLAPTSTNERSRRIAAHTSGFLYLVSLTGVTGARKTLDANLEGFIHRARQVAHTPVGVGFGISTPEQAQKVGQMADGIIVGSALIAAVGQAKEPCRAAASFVRSLKAAL